MCEVICVDDAVERIEDGAVVMIGGFMGSGTPPRLIDALVRQKKSDLTIISNDTAKPGIGIGKLIDAGLVRKVITSHIGTNPITQKLMIAEELDVELVPQGTLAERIRAGGFGLGGVLTRTGVGTLAAEGETTLEVDGETYVLAKPLRADVALINAKLTDYLGNLTYSLTARNFNPLMAMAADKVFAEAEAIVPVGTLAPDVIATPHVLVDYLVSKEACHG
ncbi:3-oxoacid CoA-transferase subunit A [Afifella sp. JA880]|uniref:CoA transferase subunit A n=1 Tax=Afifella sp. JA880 TaxID=2975280 RepID=UPI0021BAD951|nr:3-oxoacid CoA-transferase subunit A [Afifella sp. JA880]MCT8267725.1 3-oxoacid CoA-transferase subunit A [Afifella sp. JA880]